MFHGKNGCDCKDNTYSICYVLKYSKIVLPDTLNPNGISYAKYGRIWAMTSCNGSARMFFAFLSLESYSLAYDAHKMVPAVSEDRRSDQTLMLAGV